MARKLSFVQTIPVVTAQEAPFPEPDDVLTDVYVDG